MIQWCLKCVLSFRDVSAIHSLRLLSVLILILPCHRNESWLQGWGMCRRGDHYVRERGDQSLINLWIGISYSFHSWLILSILCLVSLICPFCFLWSVSFILFFFFFFHYLSTTEQFFSFQLFAPSHSGLIGYPLIRVLCQAILSFPCSFLLRLRFLRLDHRRKNERNNWNENGLFNQRILEFLFFYILFLFILSLKQTNQDSCLRGKEGGTNTVW